MSLRTSSCIVVIVATLALVEANATHYPWNVSDDAGEIPASENAIYLERGSSRTLAKLIGHVNVESLTIVAVDTLGADAAATLVALPNLRSLTIDIEGGRFDRAFWTSLASSKSLQALAIQRRVPLTDSDVAAILGLQQLRELHFCSSAIIESTSMALRQCTRLMTLRLEGILTSESIEVIRTLTQLKTLDLSGTMVLGGALSLTPLKELEGLTSLAFPFNYPKDSDNVKWIQQCSMLNSIHLVGDVPLPREMGAEFAKMSKLQDIAVVGRLLDDVFCESLGRIVRLQSLRVATLGFANGPAIDRQSLRQIVKAKTLKVLDLPGCHALTTEDLVSLAGLTHLQELRLEGCRSVTGDSLQAISAISGLRVLRLAGTFNDDICIGIEKLTRLRRLTHLDLSGTIKVDQATAMAIGRMTLKHLTTKGWTGLDVGNVSAMSSNGSLESLDLTRSDVDDEGIAAVVKANKALRRIDLVGTVIGTAALKAVADLSAVQYLNLQNCTGLKVAHFKLLQETRSLRMLLIDRTALSIVELGDLRVAMTGCLIIAN